MGQGAGKGKRIMYENSNEWLKQKKIKMELERGVCEDCSGVAKDIHHIDGSKSNHSLDNLMALCVKCHKGNYHAGPRGPQKKRASKFIYSKIIIYRRKSLGLNQKDVAKIANMSRFRFGEIERGDSDNITISELSRIASAISLIYIEDWIKLDDELEVGHD